MLNLKKLPTDSNTLYKYGDKKGFSSTQLDEAVWRINRGLNVSEDLLKTYMEYLTIYVMRTKQH